jgi:hypothetical protein
MIADGRSCQRWSSDFLGIETMVGRMAQGLRSSRADQQAEWLEKELLDDKVFSNTLAAFARDINYAAPDRSTVLGGCADAECSDE